MVSRRDPQHLTVEEWRDLELRSHESKHEYIDGLIYAMSGGSLAHARIGLNVCMALENALAGSGKPCFVYNSDAAARLSSKRYTYPDASVTCDEHDQPNPDKTEVHFPRIIIEVMSDSTEAYDRGKKFGYYRACPYVQEYVLVSTKYQAVEVYRRTSQLWTYQAYETGDEIELTSINIRFPVSALYRNAGVPELTDNAEDEV
ncbi:MAG: Uma2 family endonuclease [Ktedonobacteraceae bacterium]